MRSEGWQVGWQTRLQMKLPEFSTSSRETFTSSLSGKETPLPVRRETPGGTHTSYKAGQSDLKDLFSLFDSSTETNEKGKMSKMAWLQVFG